ncbi:MAG: glycoside hydrolase family 113, partial [bacterium]
PFIVEPLAGTLVNFLIDTWGREGFLKNYSHWNPAAPEIRRLEQGWHVYLRQIADKYIDRIKRDYTAFPRATSLYKGFNYAHQGERVRIRIDNGYLSRMSDQSLEKLRAIGVNAIAIVPYTYMNDRHKPSPLLPLRDFNKETDESVIHALLTAKRLSMSVMLKPQIQGGIDWPGKIGWSGFIAMNTETEWDLFFYYYARWILHYAIIAEMYQVEVLCVGNELSKATLHNEKRWVELIRKLRKIYSGQIVYAANWGEEFERLAFWDAFDFIGINSYYPLSEKNDPTDEELKKGADAIVKQIEAVHKRYSKPVLFTEIGFPNREAPWKQPYDKKHNAPVNFKHQARCYDVMFKAIEGKSWVRGIFWWRWPVGFKIASDEFTLGDHAEQVVANWYKQRL